jgi:hypothetical protein
LEASRDSIRGTSSARKHNTHTYMSNMADNKTEMLGGSLAVGPQMQQQARR